MNDDVLTIRQNRLFENVNEDVIVDRILPGGRMMSFAKGENIFMPLDRVNTVQILLSGKVKLIFFMENGEQDIKNMLFPGNLVGIDLICTRTGLAPYQATAAEDSRIFSLPADNILKPGTLPEKDRLACISNLLLILSQTNMQNEYRLAILTRNSLRERVMVYLTMQAKRNQSDSFTIPFTREEMASFLRVNRSALSHELSLLKQEGIIDFSKNSFSLKRQENAEHDLPLY